MHDRVHCPERLSMKQDHQKDRKIKFRLGTKFLVSIVLLECLLMSAMVFVVEIKMRQSIMDEFLKRGFSVSRNLAAINEGYIATYNYVKIEQTVEQVKEKNGLLYAVISFFDGEVAAYSGKQSIRQEVCNGDLYHRTTDIKDEFVQYGEIEGQKLCDIAVPIFLKGEKWGTVRAGFSLDDIRANILSTRKLLLSLGIIGLFFGYLTSHLLARRITRPIGELVKSVDLISNGQYDHPIQIHTMDEIGYLGHRFAAMQMTLKKHIDLLLRTNEQLQSEVAARKQKEQELRSAKKAAEAANIAKSNFLANISHELRTPLNGVLGLTELIIETTDQSDRQRMLLNNIHRSGKTLLSIINEVLDFSAIETSKLKLRKADFNLINAIEETAEFMAVSAQKNGLELACLIHNDVPVNVFGDEKRLRQVLTNIIGNAVKFTNQGEIVIRVEVMKRDAQEALLRFEVLDTGIGITAEAQASIFDPFYQADGSHSRQYGGTGLGLSIARELTELMGGTIHVDSQLGHGATFWFTVPFERPSGHAAENLPVAGRLSEDFTVLLVDGNDGCRSILNYYLTHLGIECREFSDAAQVQKGIPKDDAGAGIFVVFMDTTMSGTDALEVVQRIRSHTSPATAKFVLLAPIGFKHEENQALMAECHDYLAKPVRRAQLYDCLMSLKKNISGPKPAPTRRKDPAGCLQPPGRYRVLLAEDNEINRIVSCEMLENLGCSVEIAVNGREVVEAFDRQPYDLIAMDCQMPEIDGYEAARIIREKEKASRSPDSRIPIVALTAHTTEGDRKRCHDAGMDDYLTKPYTMHQLRGAISRFLPVEDLPGSRGTKGVRLPSENTEIAKASIDHRALEQLRGLPVEKDLDLLTKVIQIYLKEASKQLNILRSAVSENDIDAVETAASKLRSSSCNLGAAKLSELCKEFEAAVKGKSNGNGSAVFSRLEEEYQNVRVALEAEMSRS